MKTGPLELVLTLKQRSVLECVQWYIAQHRRPPLIREVQQACGIASYKSAVDRLNALERKGFIKRRPNKHRGIKIVRKAAASPFKVRGPSLERVGGGVTA